MSKVIKDPSTALFPVPVVLATAVDTSNKPNIITLAWVANVCSDPPQIGISVNPSRYSHGLIADSGEFVVNIPTANIARQVDYCGTNSGRQVDKFKETGLTPETAQTVRAPLIKECPVNIECVVKHRLPLGSHELFVGQVVAVHVDKDVLTENDRIDIAKVNPFAYSQREYWTLKEKIGSFGYKAKAKAGGR